MKFPEDNFVKFMIGGVALILFYFICKAFYDHWMLANFVNALFEFFY